MSASNNVANIGIHVFADTAGAEQGLRRVGSAASGLTSGLSETTTAFLQLGVALAAAKVAMEAIQAVMESSDVWTVFNNRIHAVSDSMGTFAATSRAVYKIAQDAGVPLEDAAGAYTRLQGAVQGMGYSQSEVLQTTEGLIMSFKTFGLTGREAAETVRQLGQGLGKGKLDGDELRAVMEASIPVSDAIAKAFRVQRSELKKLGEEGKLTADIVFPALLAASKEFEEQFANSDRTFAEGFNKLENSADRFIGVFMKAQGMPSIFTQAVGAIADTLDKAGDGILSGKFGKYTEIIGGQWRSLVKDASPIFDPLISYFELVGLHIAENFSRGWYMVLPELKALIQSITVGALDKITVVAEAVRYMYEMMHAGSLAEKKIITENAIARAKANVEAYEGSKKAIADELDLQIKAAEEKIKTAKELDEQYQKEKSEQAKKLDEKQKKEETPFKLDADLFKKLDKEASASIARLNDKANQAFKNEMDLETRKITGKIGLQEAYDKKKAALTMDSFSKHLNSERRHEADLEKLRHAAGLLGLQRTKEFKDAELQIEAEYWHGKVQMAVSSNDTIAKSVARHHGAMAGELTGALQDTLQKMGQHSKKAFEVSKIWSIADATIAMFRGIANANSLPPPASYVAMAIAAANGIMQIQQISSTQFGGGTKSAPAPMKAPDSGSGSLGGASGGGAAAPAPMRVLRVEGMDPASLFTGSQIKTITEEIDKFRAAGGGKVLF